MKPVLLAASAALFSVTHVSSPCRAQTTGNSFNSYILEAIADLEKNWGLKGYDINKAYTHDLPYRSGSSSVAIKASGPPLTMCVAAVAEVMVTAFNIYFAKTRDATPFSYVPAAGWSRMRYNDIRSHIWVDSKLNSNGTADALVTFGMGKHAKFSELKAGSFINLNRERPGAKPSGHAVVFLAYIDKDANELSKHDPAKVAGFKYFSSQGVGTTPTAGFGFRYAFFNQGGKPYCPNITGKDANGRDKIRDCGVVFSNSQKLLTTGYMLMPADWNSAARDKNLADLAKRLYAETKSRGPAAVDIDAKLPLREFTRILGDKDVMVLNPKFDGANITE